MASKYPIEDIKTAYLKLKHYVYYDNSLLFLRASLAEFEAAGKIESKFQEIVKVLSGNTMKASGVILSSWYDEIKFRIIPKTFQNRELESDGNLITNRPVFKENKVQKLNYFIDCPIELHIISVLWIMKIGYQLEGKLDNCNYGYRLTLDDTYKVRSGLSLYKSYITQYPKWRNKAIQKSKSLLNDNYNVAILGLDIKNFYHSVKLDFNELKEEIGKTPYDRLTVILKQVYRKYTANVQSFNGDTNTSDKCILPIGLLSSGVLANWYLSKLDKQILEDLNPSYYGRYVDDILIVIQNPKINYEGNQPLKSFITKYLVSTGILSEVKGDEYVLSEYEDLHIQSKKISLGDFDSNGSSSVLDKFEKNIIQSASEFNYLPEGDFNESDLESDIHNLTYSGSPHQLRSLTGFQIDKFLASKFIAKAIFNASLIPQQEDKKIGKQILNIFKGIVGLEFHNLWEKITTYFIITNQVHGFLKFIKDVDRSIEMLEFDICIEQADTSELANKCKVDFKEYFRISYSLAIALNPSFCKERNLYNYIEKFKTELILLARYFRQSNLLRHHYVKAPALTFTQYCTKGDRSLIELPITKINKKLVIDDQSIKYSPRYVPLSELIAFKVQQLLSNHKDKTNPLDLDTDYRDQAFNSFYQINYENRFLQNQFEVFSQILKKILTQIVSEMDFKDQLKNQYFKIQLPENSSSVTTLKKVIELPASRKKSRIKIAIANHLVKFDELMSGITSKSKVTRKRLKELYRLLNQAKREKADLVVLPENSVPFQWIDLLNEYVKKNGIAIICGLEHLNLKRVVYNYQAIILPIEFGGIKDSFLSLRLKNHYSDSEEFNMKEYGYKVPKSKRAIYELYKWSGLSFSTYNCFELADIEHRTIFKSDIDFVVATEYNKDTEYFSSVVESATRDLHCYFIQVNSSDYGDSRITQPAKSFRKDLIRLKGGENDAILTCTLDIKKLRDFQLKGYGLQKDDDNFKPTPPGFSRKKLKLR